MCGIVGYAGDRNVIPVLLGGLSKLEYRGYDSAGVAFLADGKLETEKSRGRLSVLSERISNIEACSTIGVGHTRWATHGEPSDINSHPHTNQSGNIAVVHNGIIENFLSLKKFLVETGVNFVSETDTEVVAHLINHYYVGDLVSAFSQAIKMLEGSFALAVLCADAPDTIVCVRKDAPLVLGFGENENLIASDIPAVLKYTNKVHFLNDLEVAVVSKTGVAIFDEYGRSVAISPVTIDWSVEQAEKQGWEHFMIKEIFEQPKALSDTLLPRIKDGRIDLSDMGITEELISGIEKITIVACGTASHAGYLGKYVIEKLARVSVEVDIASEFRYRNPILYPGQLFIVISQSGETADTIAAMREAQKAGIKVIAVTNVMGSTVAREADAVFYMRAGIEIAVASTKAYTCQLLSVYMIALEIARIKGKLTDEQYEYYLSQLKKLPELAKIMLEEKSDVQRFASERFAERGAFYIGRGLDYALAMEASLKLKEVSYVHSEAYAAGELKHGTIALIENDTLVVALATQGELIEKSISNIKEVKARGAFVWAVVKAGATNFAETVDKITILPEVDDLFAPILTVIPMQMFAYYMALEKGCDVDKPRNLAKSVTVE